MSIKMDIVKKYATANFDKDITLKFIGPWQIYVSNSEIIIGYYSASATIKK